MIPASYDANGRLIIPRYVDHYPDATPVRFPDPSQIGSCRLSNKIRFDPLANLIWQQAITGFLYHAYDHNAPFDTKSRCGRAKLRSGALTKRLRLVTRNDTDVVVDENDALTGICLHCWKKLAGGNN